MKDKDKDKILKVILNVFKVKSIGSFVAMGAFLYLVVNNRIETATTTAIIMLVFQNLFDKDKIKENKEDEEK